MVAFEIVVVVVCVASAVIAAVTFARATRLYDGTLGMSHDDQQAAGTREIVREEVRQMSTRSRHCARRRGSRPFHRTCCTSSRWAPEGAQEAIAAEIGPVLGPSATPAAWSRARVWFGDERCVSPKDLRSDTVNERVRLVVGVERPGLPPFVPR